MTIDDDITNILKEEGPPTNDPIDKGGRTKYGISEKSHPEFWANGQDGPTEAQARTLYAQKYVRGPGFDKILDPSLQAQLIDYGVNSGPMVAIQKLQAILKVPVDGVLGLNTLSTITRVDPKWLNNQLVGARVLMFAKLVTNVPSQSKFLIGWITRAISFLV